MSLGGWVDLGPNPDTIRDPELEEFPSLIVRTPGCQPIFLAHGPILSSEFRARLPAGRYPAR